MGREFVDFYVKKMDGKVAAALTSMGYNHVCVTDYRKPTFEDNVKLTGLRIHKKVVVEAGTRSELLQYLRNVEKNALVSVKPLTREALMVAARDGRVTTVLVHGEIAEIDRHVMQVSKNFFEISVSEIVDSFKDSRRWSNLLKVCRTVTHLEIPLIISSGASNAEEILPPHQLAYVLAAFRDSKALDFDAVSTIPLKVLKEGLV